MRIKGRETKWTPNFKQYDVLLFTVPCIMIQFMKMTNKMQLCRIIYCSLTALHVSSDILAHHQEHLNCIYSFWYYSLMSLPADVKVEFLLNLGISRQQHTWIIPEAVNAVNPLNPELNPICYLLALLAHHFLHVSRIKVKSLTLRLLMSYIYGGPILDVSRSHTTTQHSR